MGPSFVSFFYYIILLILTLKDLLLIFLEYSQLFFIKVFNYTFISPFSLNPKFNVMNIITLYTKLIPYKTYNFF